MNAHSRKIYEAITTGRAPRDLEWTQFVRFWQDVADDIEQESGDRLAVHANGRRVVFRRAHDGRVPIDDIEHARALLAAEAPADRGAGRLLVVAIDERTARLFDFDLDADATADSERTVSDSEVNSRHLRTVEKKSGRDDAQELSGYFDEVAEALSSAIVSAPADAPLVVIGHGSGKASAAAGFVDRLQKKHSAVAHRVRGVGDVDLSAATDTQLEEHALSILRRG